MKTALSAALAAATLVGVCAIAQTPAQHAGAAQAPSGIQPGADGGKLYAANCSACHQPMGQGIEGAFPKLAGNPFLVGDPKAVSLILLNGRGGMPSFRDDLADAQLSAVASHVRASWGNQAPPITTADFAALRSGAQAASERPIPAH